MFVNTRMKTRYASPIWPRRRPAADDLTGLASLDGIRRPDIAGQLARKRRYAELSIIMRWLESASVKDYIIGDNRECEGIKRRSMISCAMPPLYEHLRITRLSMLLSGAKAR